MQWASSDQRAHPTVVMAVPETLRPPSDPGLRCPSCEMHFCRAEIRVVTVVDA